MQHQTPLALIPGSWDELIARAALRLVSWLERIFARRQRVDSARNAPVTADDPRRSA